MLNTSRTRAAEPPGQTVDLPGVLGAVARIVESRRYDAWLMDMPEDALTALAAPLEMLQFQHYAFPPDDRLLVRAARVTWESAAGHLQECPADLAREFAALGAALENGSPAKAGAANGRQAGS